MKSSNQLLDRTRAIEAIAIIFLTFCSVGAFSRTPASIAPATVEKSEDSSYPHAFSRTCPSKIHEVPDPSPRKLSISTVLPLSAATARVGGSKRLKSLRAVGAIWSQGQHRATAVLVGEQFVLTVAHKIPSREWLSDHVFVVNWNVNYDASYAKLDGSHRIRCFPLLIDDDMVASPAGHLDYVLLRIGREVDKNSKSHWPSHYGVTPIAPANVSRLPDEGETIYMVGAHPPDMQGYEQLPEGMVTVVDGVVTRVARWSKDAGTSRHFDYSIYSVPGLSGSALFTQRHEWFGMHQRDLNVAKCDDLTPWHPYIAEYYFDRFANNDLASRFMNQCNDGMAPKPRESNSAMIELPRQGTPIIDIAQDIVQRRGIEWACKNVPKLVAILPALDLYSCDAKRHSRTTLFREKAAAPGVE